MVSGCHCPNTFIEPFVRCRSEALARAVNFQAMVPINRIYDDSKILGFSIVKGNFARKSWTVTIRWRLWVKRVVSLTNLARARGERRNRKLVLTLVWSGKTLGPVSYLRTKKDLGSGWSTRQTLIVAAAPLCSFPNSSKIFYFLIGSLMMLGAWHMSFECLQPFLRPSSVCRNVQVVAIGNQQANQQRRRETWPNLSNQQHQHLWYGYFWTIYIETWSDGVGGGDHPKINPSIIYTNIIYIIGYVAWAAHNGEGSTRTDWMKWITDESFPRALLALTHFLH